MNKTQIKITINDNYNKHEKLHPTAFNSAPNILQHWNRNMKRKKIWNEMKISILFHHLFFLLWTLFHKTFLLCTYNTIHAISHVTPFHTFHCEQNARRKQESSFSKPFEDEWMHCWNRTIFNSNFSEWKIFYVIGSCAKLDKN